MSRLVPLSALAACLVLAFSFATFAPMSLAQVEDRAIGTVIPSSDADLRAAMRAGEALARSGAACKTGQEQEACVLVDCGPTADAARRIEETAALLTGMQPWLDKARKAALDHYINLMKATITAGDRQAYLESWLATATYLQNIGAMSLAVLDLADFARSFKENGANLREILADPTVADFGKYLARADQVDSIVGAFQNSADVANTLIGSYREKGEPVPQWLMDMSTLKQAASDMKNAGRASAEAISLLREAEMLRRYATTVTDATEKARYLQRAAESATKGKAQWSNMRAAILQLVGKALLAISESQLAEMQAEIDEMKHNIAAELLPIQQAWLDWQRLSIRTDALAEAIDALTGASAGLGSCMANCPAGAVSAPPTPPSFVDAYGNEHWGAALRWYQDQIAMATAALSSAAYGAEPGVTPSYPPLVAPTTPTGEVPAGSEVGFEYDVDRCTASDGEVAVGDTSRPIGGETHGVMMFPVPSSPGPVNVTIRRPGRPDMSIPTEVSSAGSASTEEVCRPINCDCDNLEFGILTRPYRDECRGAEAALIQQCEATRRIEGTCHTTAQGPNAFPR